MQIYFSSHFTSIYYTHWTLFFFLRCPAHWVITLVQSGHKMPTNQVGSSLHPALVAGQHQRLNLLLLPAFLAEVVETFSTEGPLFSPSVILSRAGCRTLMR